MSGPPMMFFNLLLIFLALSLLSFPERTGLNMVKGVEAGAGHDHGSEEEEHASFAYVAVYNISCFDAVNTAAKNYTFYLVPEDSETEEHDDHDGHDDHEDHEDENTILMAVKRVHPFDEDHEEGHDDHDDHDDHDHEEEEEEIEHHYEEETEEFNEDIEHAFNDVAESDMTVLEEGLESYFTLDNSTTYQIHQDDHTSVNITFQCILPWTGSSPSFQTFAFYFNEHTTAKLYELKSDGSTLPELVSPLYDAEIEPTTDETLSRGAAWGYSILASFISTLCSVIGLLIFLFCGKEFLSTVSVYGGAFGAGAILMFVYSHIYPEARENLVHGGVGHDDLNWKIAVVFLASFVFGLLVHIFSDYASSQLYQQVSGPPEVDKENDTGIELEITNNAITVIDSENPSATLDSGEENSAVVESVYNETKKGLLDFRGVHSLAWNIIIGDFFHNFFDGVMISLAFSLCSKTYGWTVLGAIIAHEAPQEIADFMILLSAGMTVSQAALFNFLSALSALLGVIVTLLAVHDRDEINYVALGYLLLMNSGIFTYVGAVEMVPQFLNHNHGKQDTMETIKKSLLLLVFFILGTVVIGLTMLAPHLHLCSAPGEEDHHDHGH